MRSDESQTCSAINVSLYYFAVLFRQSRGVSPHRYVLHRRVERAKNCFKIRSSVCRRWVLTSGSSAHQLCARVSIRAWRKSRSIQTRLLVSRKYSKNLSQKRKNGQASEDLTHIVISVSFCGIQASDFRNWTVFGSRVAGNTWSYAADSSLRNQKVTCQPNANPADLARHIATILYGMAVQAAGGANHDKLQRVVEITLRTLPP